MELLLGEETQHLNDFLYELMFEKQGEHKMITDAYLNIKRKLLG